jgi:hypothetical protein
MSKQSDCAAEEDLRRARVRCMRRRVCTGAPVHYEQTVGGESGSSGHTTPGSEESLH